MSENEKNAPKRRFKEFENAEAWEQRKFVDTVDISTNMVDPKTGHFDNLPHIGPGNIEAFTGRLLDNVNTVKEDNLISGKFYFNKGDVIYGKINPQLGKYVYAQYQGLASADAYVLNAKNGLDQTFLFTLLQTRHFFNYSVSVSMRSGMPKINRDELNVYSFMSPCYKEQEQIGKFFLNLNNLITLHQRKLEKMKALKKAYLTEMFPAEGECKPKLRFAGFTDDWEQRKLLDMLIQPITDGPHETPELVDKGIPFISVDAIVDNRIDFTRRRGYITEKYNDECCKKYKPQFHDVYLVKSGSTVGKIAIVETYERFNIWSPLAAMRCGEKSNPYFLYYLLQTKSLQIQVFDKCSHGTQPNLGMRQLEKFNVCVPNIEDQKRIGNFFCDFDNLITLHQRKLEKLQNIKKAYLNEMFI